MLDIRGPAPAAHLSLWLYVWAGTAAFSSPPATQLCGRASAPLQTLYGRTAAFLKKGVDPLRLLARATYAPADQTPVWANRLSG